MDDWLKDIKNETVLKAALKSKAILARHSRIAVSISGGADSDVMLDLVERTKGNRHVRYIWFNTGLEYQATKDHLVYLENRYHFELDHVDEYNGVPVITAHEICTFWGGGCKTRQDAFCFFGFPNS